MKVIHLYTDGGCRGNGKEGENLGAIGGVLIYPEKNVTKEYKQAYENTTNNQMELLAVIEGLKLLKESCEVHIYSDSAYVVNAYLQNWIGSWKAKNWTRGKAGALKNREIWIELDQLVNRHKVIFHKVKGHADNPYNNRADLLVNQAMDEYRLTE
ncbi:ribonuclease HI [Acetobacterium wieringae]|uniref:ribonuclease H n=1 Tax=Acetobacterium wieringae TaxID=52694 RepID=A0ABY6HIB9_9FIRM|nr:ribonuclease HI [Acetobacterium wieringae]MEA4805152.1 ribonuclease HI [Acetobacterium wieringae]URN85811.1 ribonuclease HI [Acetobacterium wieringae]UYO64272.1 ribonuclease HI [Acetobacterium wieringae]VUZ24190.1 Ribonuclease H [Acetobacterium wieringae]